MNNYQITISSVLDDHSNNIEAVSKGLNKVSVLFRGVVYDYPKLPVEARFAFARSLQPYMNIYHQLEEKYGAMEAEERLCWCLYGSFDSQPDISSTGSNVEISSHCTSCQYEKPFCHRVLPYLTKRQQECFLLMRKGLTDKEVAEILHISFLTVIKHMNNAVERVRNILNEPVTRQYILNDLANAGI